MAASYLFYFTNLCPFADPIDRMRVWLFFLYLCSFILIRLPFYVHIMVTLSSLYVVCQTCLGLPSCCYLLEGYFEFFSSMAASFEFSYLCATISSPLAFFSFGRVSLTVGSSSYILPSCRAAASPWFSRSGMPPMRFVALLPLVMRLYFG